MILINDIRYQNVTFNTSSLGTLGNTDVIDFHEFPQIRFSSITGSFVSSSHKEMFNFNGDQDFSISFWIRPKGISTNGSVGNSAIENGFNIGNYQTQLIDNRKRYIISKSKIKNLTPIYNSDSATEEAPSEIQFPYEIYMHSSSLFFDMSDGNETKSVTTKIEGVYLNNSTPTHIFCQNSGSVMEIWKNGVKQDSTTISFKDQTRNTANLYIASSGENTVIDQSGGINSSSIENGFVVGNYVDDPHNSNRHFNGDLNNINIWSRAYNNVTIANISESINASPYIGNIFYQNGFATITHPSHRGVLNEVGVGNMSIGSTSENTFEIGTNKTHGINTLQFRGTHLIYEHEYQCTIQEHEFNSTTNLSARKNKSSTSHELADFATGSLFKPHITTVGLYNNNNELLVIGKLGQAIRSSDETDTTIIVRWDT